MSDLNRTAVLKADKVKQELGIGEIIQFDDEANQKIEEEATRFADTLCDFAFNETDALEIRKSSVEQFGGKIQEQAASKSQMLKRPIGELASQSEDGGEVANALIELKMKVEELDPGQLDLGKPGWITRTLGKLPFVGNSLKRYFSRYEQSQTIINAIINSLKNGKEQLKRDNMMLLEDQKGMRSNTLKLEKAIKLAQAIDTKLEYKLAREIPADDPKHDFIKDELLFVLRQRIMDLQQQLAVNQQGVLSIELIRRNNQELIRGVDRACNVTVNALQVAVTVALALNHQKIVLDKINALNTTTSNLIAGTAARLRTQGAEIQKQASSSALNVEALKNAFTDINAALEDISKYRQQALPEMAKNILEFDTILSKGEESIKKLESGNKAAPAITFDLD